jgi:uncharacterized RDD family membrane protein YckC
MAITKPAFHRRIRALAVDYLVNLAWMAILGVLSLMMYLLMDGYPDFLGSLGSAGSQLLFFVLLTLPVGVYLYLTESGSRHATCGKAVSSLTVIDVNGDAPSHKQASTRTVVKLLPWEVAHSFIWQMQYEFYLEGPDATPPAWVLGGLNAAMLMLVIYTGMVYFRRDGRGPHDIVARTRVTTTGL